MRCVLLGLVTVVLVGCTNDFGQFEPAAESDGAVEEDSDPASETAIADSDTADSATADSDLDGEPIDSTPIDSSAPDATVDSTPADSSSVDSTPVDSGKDSTATDTAVTDSLVADSAKPDGSATDAADTSVPCTEAESKTLGGHCYFPVAPQRFTNASSACIAKGAHLATISSVTEELLVESIRPTKERWIGLLRAASDPPTATASFKWITGEAKPFEKWGAGEPNGTGECARLKPGTLLTEWADQDCKTSLDAICERD